MLWPLNGVMYMSARVVFDIESNGLHDADTVWCISAQDMNSEVIQSWDVRQGNIDEGLKYLAEADELIGHNISGFDLPLLEKLHGFVVKETTIITDTLVWSRTGHPDRRKPTNYTGKGGPHSLECWGYRVRRAKPSHEDWTVFSSAMLQRNREDVGINKLTHDLLSKELAGHDWSEAFRLETEINRIITQQEIHGVLFDVKRALDLVQQLDDRIDGIDAELLPRLPITYKCKGATVRKPFKVNGDYTKMVEDWFTGTDYCERHIISGPFTRIEGHKLDLGSIKQVKDYLLTQGWIPTQYNYDDEGNRTSAKLTEDSYGTIVGDFGKLIKDRILFRHRRGQIQGWLDRIRDDGRVSAYANPCGTNTGRMRHAGIVNIPKATSYPKEHEHAGELVYQEDTEFQKVFLGTEMRSLFIVPPYFKLVGHDAEQLELRLLAHYMNDQDYIQEILHGDIHTANQIAAGLSNRDDAKTFIYAFLYGAGDDKLGSIVGGNANDGAALRRKFLSSLPSLKRLIARVKRATDKGWLRGLDNRKIWMRNNEDGTPMKHKALNTLLQCGGAVLMKKSAIILDLNEERRKLRAYKIMDMHDEGQHEVFYMHAQRFAELAVDSVVQAGVQLNLNIPMAASYKIGRNLAETH